MRTRGTGFVVLLAAALVIGTWVEIEACGPDFDATLFVNKKAPDDARAFAQGKLGLLQAGFNSDAYAVAFRYLNGGKLSPAEQSAYVPPKPPTPSTALLTPEQFAKAQEAEREARSNASAPGGWLRERAKYVSATALTVAAPSFPAADYAGDIVFDPDYLNCTDASFRTAADTLRARAASWGTSSPWLADWIHGQDAVFQNCAATGPGAMPLAAAANGPALLRADRAYQMAAAQFYAKQFDVAAQAFAAIADDKASPWSPWGKYLAARATVRRAFALGTKTNPYSDDLANFDMATMRQAQSMLQALLEQQNPGPSRSAVVQELNLVRMRTEPGKRLAEICAALAGPGPDENFSNDLSDLNFVLLKRIPIEQAPPLFQWIAGWREGGGGTTGRRMWNEGKGLPWLVLAMYQTEATDAAATPLLAAASGIKPENPAYDTLFFQQVRLLIGSRRGEQARTMLDKVLPEVTRQQPGSYSNALLGQRMAVARTFDEFLQYAPRNELAPSPLPIRKTTWSCSGNPVWMHQLGHCPAPNQPPSFDVDSISVLNLHTPLTLLVEAAGSPNLPPNLRDCLILAAWTRSVALEDAANAARLVPLLPDELRKTVGDGTGFAAELAILRNPGLRPYLESGTSRLENVSELDTYRDNWWTQRWQGRYQSESPQLDQPQYAQFLSEAQIAEGEAESHRLVKSAGVVLIGRRVVEYAKAHPDEAEVPAALALVVRATRYGSQDWDEPGRSTENTAVSKAAFDLLHSSYPQSPWTAKTPYYY